MRNTIIGTSIGLLIGVLIPTQTAPPPSDYRQLVGTWRPATTQPAEYPWTEISVADAGPEQLDVTVSGRHDWRFLLGTRVGFQFRERHNAQEWTFETWMTGPDTMRVEWWGGGEWYDVEMRRQP